MVDRIEPKHMSPREVLNKYLEECQSITTIFRVVSWVLSFIGHILLFSPIIAVLKWIPLIGWLLASVVKFAAVLFALVWATFLHFLVLGAAWVFYRPVLGITMLALAGICLFVMSMTGEEQVQEAVPK